jgi:hypothetical protein
MTRSTVLVCARGDSQRPAAAVDSEIGETGRAGADGSLASPGRESEYVRAELVIARVDVQSPVAVEHDDHNVDPVIDVRVDARSRIKVREADARSSPASRLQWTPLPTGSVRDISSSRKAVAGEMEFSLLTASSPDRVGVRQDVKL